MDLITKSPIVRAMDSPSTRFSHLPAQAKSFTYLAHTQTPSKIRWGFVGFSFEFWDSKEKLVGGRAISELCL